ncbi:MULTISPECIES: ribbon-helix-helix protein, CopG family [Nostocales]|nr:ribbon-helix-helix protein, CopG family [Tolypothrix bouteillei]
MAKVTVTLYIEEDDKEALQKLADAEERSLSQMAVLILKQRLKPSQAEGKSRQLKVQVRNDATVKQPGVSDSSAQYRTNGGEVKPKGNVRLTAAYLQPQELQELAQRVVELENAADGSELKFKVQIELDGGSQLSDDAMAQLKEILQEISEDFQI